jgi:hypothetical protein
MRTNPTRYTARPSRSRITRARVGAWIDRNSDTLTALAVALVVVILTTLTALALVTDGVNTRDAIGASAVTLASVLFASFFAYAITDDRATRRAYARYSRTHAQVVATLNNQIANAKRETREAIGGKPISEMSAYEISAELARMSEREHNLRYALRYSRSDGMATSTALRK